MKKLTLVEWMIKHKVSSQHTNINLAIARALNSEDLKYNKLNTIIDR